jgi:hypothetical protein
MSVELDEMLSAPVKVDVRTLPVRFSRLKKFALSAAHYRAACLADEDDESLALRLGSGVHAILLGKPVVRYPARRAGKAWEAFAAENAGKVILNAKEWFEAQSMALAIGRNKEASTLLFDDTIIETPIDWSFARRACQSTPDAYGKHHVVELKTCRTSNPVWFIRDALRLQYHAQLAYYCDAIENYRTWTPEKAYIVAVEKTDPYPVTIFELTERALELGRRMNRLWFEQLLTCEAGDFWPEYTQSIVPFDIPDMEPTELIINGERMELE